MKQNQYPSEFDSERVGTYDARACAGGGFVWDAVLEYRGSKMMQFFLLIVTFAIAQLSPHDTLAQSSAPQLIPLNVSRPAPHVTITGSALRQPFEIMLDTGSWTTSFPESAVDASKREVIDNGPVNNGWGDECRLVKGQLAMIGTVGTKQKVYTVENMEFYEILETKKDGTKQFGHVIMGAFPSLAPGSGKPSFTFALAKTYSTADTFGYGFVSESPLVEGRALDVGEGWNKLNLSLLLGAGSQKTEGLNWRTNIPLAHKSLGFCPEMVPGFTIRVNISDSKPQAFVSQWNICAPIQAFSLRGACSKQ